MRSGVISVFIGRLPEMKITEPYSPTARAKASVKPVSSAGSDGRQDDAPEHVEAPGAQGLGRLLQVALHLQQRRLHGAHREGHADQGEGERHADPGVGDLDAERLEVAADPAVLREHRGEGDARDRRGQRERHVDERIDELAPRELVAHQRPGDDEAEHEVDARRPAARRRRTAGRSRARARSRPCARSRSSACERGRQHQGRQRQQHDGAQEDGREAEGEPEARQDARLAEAHASPRCTMSTGQRPPSSSWRKRSVKCASGPTPMISICPGAFGEAARELLLARRRSAARCASPGRARPAPPSAHPAARACRAGAAASACASGRCRRRPPRRARAAARSRRWRAWRCAPPRPIQWMSTRCGARASSRQHQQVARPAAQQPLGAPGRCRG